MAAVAELAQAAVALRRQQGVQKPLDIRHDSAFVCQKIDSQNKGDHNIKDIHTDAVGSIYDTVHCCRHGRIQCLQQVIDRIRHGMDIKIAL